MTEIFVPYDWYWVVGDDESRAWSSSAGTYVTEHPADRTTRIGSEPLLNAVLRGYGLTVPAPEQIDYQNAIQAHIDATAQDRDFHDGVHAASYYNSTIPNYAADAATFVAWRDAVWVYAYTEMAKVQGGQRAQPSVGELVAELPAIAWPG